VQWLVTATSTIAKKMSFEAYNAYENGRSYQRLREYASALPYFQRATELDPSYAPAWVGLAQSLKAQAGKTMKIEEGYRLAREAAERAIAMDANLGDAHAQMGWLKMTIDWDWQGARTLFEHALAIESWSVLTIRGCGALARMEGRLDESLAFYDRALELDPLNPSAYGARGTVLYYLGRHEEARTALAEALKLSPDQGQAHALLAEVYLAQFHPEEALTEAQKEPDEADRLQALAYAYYALGRKKESDVSLAELISKFQEDEPYSIGQVYAYRGEFDLALNWLERAYDTHDDALVNIKGDPILRSLVNKPRYAALLNRMHLSVH
jgi:tetratricopeptide (TPR) repeat protein